MLPYAPKGLDKLDSKFRDSRNPPHWVGVDAYAAVVCYNTIEAEKFNLPKPLRVTVKRCGRDSNFYAFYSPSREKITVCTNYIDELYRDAPK